MYEWLYVYMKKLYILLLISNSDMKVRGLSEYDVFDKPQV